MDCYLVIKRETEQIVSCGNRVDGEEIYVPQDCEQVIIGEDELYSAREYCKYNKITGEFYEQRGMPAPAEQYQATTLLNQAEILANQRQQDKVMAAILLEQVGGEANV